MARSTEKIGRNPFDKKSYRKTGISPAGKAPRNLSKKKKTTHAKSNLLLRLKKWIQMLLTTLRGYTRARRYA